MKRIILIGMLSIIVMAFFNCATGGVWGSVDRISEREVSIHLSVPPISGGSGANLDGKAAEIMKKEAQKYGYRYFILIIQGAMITNVMGSARYGGNAVGDYVGVFILEEELDEVREDGFRVYDINYMK